MGLLMFSIFVFNYSKPLLSQRLWSIQMYVLFVKLLLKIIRRVPHVEQEQLTLPGYLSSSRFLVGFICMLLDLKFSVSCLLCRFLQNFDFLNFNKNVLSYVTFLFTSLVLHSVNTIYI
jgi:hypothetical protein